MGYWLVTELKFVTNQTIYSTGQNPDRDGGILARLRDKSELSASVCYTTLSHRWGDNMPFKLLDCNLDQCRREIPLEAISKVFQDAMNTILKLGFSYIWI